MPRRRANRWKDAAAEVAQALPRGRLDPAVLAWTERHAGDRAPWFVALSGGADSVVLLLLLWAHWPERRRRLRAIHFDHRLRGAASRADAGFCRRLCRSLEVPLVEGAWRRPGRSGPGPVGAAKLRPSEADARDARLAFFRRHARILWLGHQQDDVAETLLMRLARGSGAGGLSAPRPVQPMPGGRIHLRPLLALRKQEIVAVLRAAGLPWREDATNAMGDFLRNRIRRDVLPAWAEAARRDAIAGAARSRELLEEDDVALDAWVERLAPIGQAGDLLLGRLRGVPRAVRRRALYRWLLGCRPAVDIARQAFEALLAATERERPTRHSLGPAAFAVLHKGRLKFEAGKPRTKFQRRVN